MPSTFAKSKCFLHSAPISKRTKIQEPAWSHLIDFLKMRILKKTIISLRLELSKLWHFKAVWIFMAKIVRSWAVVLFANRFFVFFYSGSAKIFWPKYYLGKKNLPARLHVYLRLESTNHKKIGEIILALQICKRSTQTGSV